MKYVIRLLLILIIFIIISGIWLYFSLPDPSVLKTKNPKTTAIIEQRLQEAKSAGKTLRIHQEWVTFDQIPPLLRRAIRISEDAGFYIHRGIDFNEVWEAVQDNIEEGGIKRGASTITQQLAKNLYLSTDRSILRKIREYFIAKHLEAKLSKYRIYHLYLNIIEFGPGIFGIGAASKKYFTKNVTELTPDEMIRLAAIIPKPLQIRPTSNEKWIRWRCCWITEKLYKYEYIEEPIYRSLSEEYCAN
jgi:monofunctional biosynthetic peptidoglycan transglycosylase